MAPSRGMRSAVLGEATVLQWRARWLSEMLRAWKEAVSILQRRLSLEPCSSRVQSLRSQRFFRHWLQSYKLLQLCRRRASSAANSPGIVAAFHAWCSYGRARQAKEQLRRTAQRFRRRQLLRKTLRRFQGGVEEARDAETRAGRFHGLKAGQLTKQLFGSWQQLVDFGRGSRADGMRCQQLQMKALSGFQLYQGWRRGKIAAQATARSHQRMQSIKRCLDTFKSFIDMRRRTAAARAALHRSTRRRRRSGAVGAWRARSVELRSARRQDEMTAMAHHTRCLLQDLWHLWLFRSRQALQSRQRLRRLELSLARQAGQRRASMDTDVGIGEDIAIEK
ncbi:unnamed protein product [Durusdinium trenchii]|uniref:Sfi1 spindle body domain-containing protein n=2 Tax=Durusdinium trenchii TaxID=1381693 RepID=A0ABP0LUR0_9DINO